MFALVVRFELVDEYAAQGFDALLAKALPYISAEPGTLLYLAHTVEDAPLSRIFYELYENRDAHRKHESYDHTSRFLAEKDQYLTGFRVEFLGRAHRQRPTATQLTRNRVLLAHCMSAVEMSCQRPGR